MSGFAGSSTLLSAANSCFSSGHGRTKVMLGTNYPMITWRKALENLDDLALDDEAKALFLGGNAMRVFGLSDRQEIDFS